MYGLKTRWFRDPQGTGTMKVGAKGRGQGVSPKTVLDRSYVDEVKGKFALKYGAGDGKKYYPTSEVALEVGL